MKMNNISCYLINKLKYFELGFKEEMKYLFNDWLSFTDIHGIPRIMKSKYMILRIIWLLSFITGLIATIYLLITTIIVYYQYNEITNTQIISDLPSQFPTVTICNLNQFYVNYNSNDQNRQHYYNSCNGSYSECQNVLQNNIINCYFNGVSCKSQKEFDIFFTNENYFCFAFNFDEENIKLIGRNGPQNGLQLSLFLGDSLNINSISKSRGLRIYISNMTDKYPNVERNYIDIASGFETNIVIKRSFYKKLSAPYSNCVDDVSPNTRQPSDIMKYMFNELKIASYSFKVCEMLVFQKYLNQTCNCVVSTIGSVNWKKTNFSTNSADLNESNCYSSNHIDCFNAFNLNFTYQPTFYLGNSCPNGIFIF